MISKNRIKNIIGIVLPIVAIAVLIKKKKNIAKQNMNILIDRNNQFKNQIFYNKDIFSQFLSRTNSL